MFCVDIDKFNRIIAERMTTKEAIADEIGVERNVFNRRLRSSRFLIGDIHKICSVLRLSSSEAIEIFLSKFA